MLSRADLHDYQRRAIQFVKDNKRCFLMLEMGLGKTTSTLTAVSDLLDSFAVRKVLVIAPLRVANSVWKQEAESWEHLQHLRVEVCTGSEKQRLMALHNDADIYVINRENVQWLVERFGKRWPFDCVVVDESSSFKNSQSKRFRALRKVLPDTSHMVLLTGTPSPNGLHDLWAQCYLIDFGQALGRTLTAFRQRFFDQDHFGHKYLLREGCEERIQQLIAPFSISMQAADYLEVPERIVLREGVTLSKQEMCAYREFEDSLFMQVGDAEIEALNAAALASKLLQFAAGAMYTDEHRNWAKVHDHKIEALKDLIEQNEGESILIAYNFQSDLERILAAVPHAVVLDKNQDTIDRWNKGLIPVLLAHPASAGHGLNLQRGGSLAVWFSLNWSLELYQQFNARLHRQGQTKPVRIVHILAQGTIDDRVMMVLNSKDASQNGLMNALRATKENSNNTHNPA